MVLSWSTPSSKRMIESAGACQASISVFVCPYYDRKTDGLLHSVLWETRVVCTVQLIEAADISTGLLKVGVGAPLRRKKAAQSPRYQKVPARPAVQVYLSDSAAHIWSASLAFAASIDEPEYKLYVDARPSVLSPVMVYREPLVSSGLQEEASNIARRAAPPKFPVSDVEQIAWACCRTTMATVTI